MTLTMNDSTLISINDVKRFLKSSDQVQFEKKYKTEAYQWIEQTLVKFGYMSLNKRQKGVIKQYITKMTQYSRAQITRLISQYIETGHVLQTDYQRNRFSKIYSDADIKMLAQTEELHEFINGAAIKKILKSMAKKDPSYKNLSEISVSHIYNLRKSVCYKRITKVYTKTKPTTVNIGLRQKPQPNGTPGFIRVDTVHQGDRPSEKGVYHINTIDEVLQFEFIGAVERITEEHLIPLLKRIIQAYPFKILGFHADNGSEYINKHVVKLLNKLLIELTKSRPRHSNDNALVESKNGSIIRKWLSYGFIDKNFASDLNKFYFGCFNEYLNFHRPCAFATITTDHKGKSCKIYKHTDYMTPYEKLKSISNARQFLKKGITFRMLDKIAFGKTNNEMAKLVQSERTKLFQKIFAF
jgi:transposase InsO family protein